MSFGTFATWSQLGLGLLESGAESSQDQAHAGEGGHSMPGTFAIWKRIRLGTHRKGAELYQALVDGGFHTMPRVAHLLYRKTRVADEPRDIDLIRVTVGQLGFRQEVQRHAIMDKARALGLSLCPAEVGPQLRLQYPFQPADESLYIGMEPLNGPDGRPCAFRVHHSPWGIGLDEGAAVPDGWWPIDAIFVFCREES